VDLSFSLLFLAPAILHSAHNCRLADSIVEKFIAQTASREHAQEYCESRSYLTSGDLEGDGRDDFVVVFHVEPIGGNVSVDFMHVYLSTSPRGEPLELSLGGTDKWIAKQVTFRDRELIIETLEYQYGDASCCPSGRGEVGFKFKTGKLAQTHHTRNRPPSN